MANCCGSSRSTCRVIAGPGITVDGNGSPGAPYVIGGGGGGTTVVEAGTGVTVTGTGTAADPYEVSAVPPETGCGLTGDGSAGSPPWSPPGRTRATPTPARAGSTAIARASFAPSLAGW
ncbi:MULTISPECIES: hypothetical protein [Streptomyces]|uniref:hypothetical protein n=1 Tax=Streptomyces TaxID=1883 RepID=UPI0029A4FE2F|nr:hypothetical protein [Streptomyces europaeiscabiei]MDX3715748.1 hypothetical protein [Streptomyces europaeiscabiei]WSG20011.1 hypothetical protein OHB30_02405 [Streptomyces europaeiscabiei]